MRLTPLQFEASQAKIAKINERARKRGFTGRYELTGTLTYVTSRDMLGFERTEVYYDAELTGDPPQYGGWTFLARIDTVAGGFIVNHAPGVTEIPVDRDTLKPGYCDHCQTNRARRNTYLAFNADTGETKQVGSTCLKDFTGHDRPLVWGGKGLDPEDWGGGGAPDAWDVDTVLAYAYAATFEFGYVKVDDYGNLSTKDTTYGLLTGRKPFGMEDRDWADLLTRVGAHVNDVGPKVAEVKAYILSEDFNGGSSYVENLKVLLAGEYIETKHLGLVASAPQSYLRHLERQAQREVQQQQQASFKQSDANVYVGTVKERLELTLTVKATRPIEGQYGTTMLYTLTDDEGHLFKWFSSNWLFNENVGGRYHVKATVKDHDDYLGTKSTVLTRVALVTPKVEVTA